jgi:spermidine synthase
MRVALLSAVFLSGAAGLIYQLVWMRSLSLVVGSAHAAVAAVLAAYMGGLAIGGLLGARYAPRLARPLRAFAGLEGAVALSALAFAGVMQFVTWAVAHWLNTGQGLPADAGWVQHALYGGLALLAIAVPTICMGATLPVLVHAAALHEPLPVDRLPELYGTNTLGAAAGAAAGGFLLLPTFGIAASTGVAAALNVAAMALVTIRFPGDASRPAAAAASRAGPARTALPAGFRPLLVAAFAVSAASFALEVFWSRLLSHLLGGTIQGFALMLCVTLLGIGAGGLLARHAARVRVHVRVYLAAALVIAALATVAAYLFVSLSARGQLLATSKSVIILLAMLPAAIAVGCSFPLFVRCVAGQAGEIPRIVGFAFAASTCGAIVGSLATANLLLPVLHFEGVVAAAAGTLVAAGVAIAWPVAAPAGRTAGAIAAALAILFCAVALPRPSRVLEYSAVDRAEPSEERFFAVGRSATVQVQERPFGLLLRGDGLPEALISRRGAVPGLDDQGWLGTLGAMARPDARSMLMVGLGGGVALEGIPPSIARIDVVEIEPEVVAANAFVAAERRHDPLRDARVRITVNDARNALQRTSASYDVIVSQPSHPWTTASANLYSREFVGLVRSRLTPDGVFVQWMNAGFVDGGLLRSLVATLAAEFPHVQVYEPIPMSLVFLASAAPIDPKAWFASEASRAPGAVAALRRSGITLPEDLDWSLLLADPEVRALAAGAEPVTDDLNVLAMRTRPGAGMGETEFAAVVGPLDRASRITATGPAADYVLYRLTLARRDRLDRAGALRGAASEEALAFERAVRRIAQPVTRASTATMPAAESAALGPAAAVLRGWDAARNGDTTTLRELDFGLAGTSRKAPWFAAAARLRAEWRLAEAARAERGSAERRRLAAEALGIIDDAVVSSATTDLLFQRAAAAELAEDVDVLLESAAALTEMVEHGLHAHRDRHGTPPPDAELQLRRLGAVRALVAAAAPDPRSRQVLGLMDGAIGQLGASASAGPD